MNVYPDAYVAYLVEFHVTRDYFECHELLEEYWKDHPADGKSRLWVGLIQLAVGQYHHRRGNVRGAYKIYRQALLRLSPANLAEAGLDGGVLLPAVNDIAGALERGEPLPYRPWSMPIANSELEERCRSACRRLGLNWDAGVTIPVEEVVHRHKLRDRSAVLEARRKSLEAKNALRRKC
ncbi:DUF309 domain-containing protein [Paenibacillus beijingensis]|uniref:DUF309 domain-containing protein n=1 Tax=Paenibacillus beijingensis TaxID=1126833 RepID=A0A0D5NP88_9BACL|nr:DUF309 domain-containing protein [Paenibacillus beijingensis]AJY77096.1 hypothetical protein VN24_24285 [Paenibacillus beijingensis]